MKRQKRKRYIPKRLTKRERGKATAQLMRMNVAFKRAGMMDRAVK